MPQVMQKILMVIRSKTGHDFSHYKKSTVRRRIQRRINVHNLTDPAIYLRYLQEHPEEARQLFKEMLINVTSFFREPEAFEVPERDGPAGASPGEALGLHHQGMGAGMCHRRGGLFDCHSHQGVRGRSEA